MTTKLRRCLLKTTLLDLEQNVPQKRASEMLTYFEGRRCKDFSVP